MIQVLHYIDMRAQADKEERDSFWNSMVQEFIKQFISLAMSTTAESILDLIIDFPERMTEHLEQAIKTKAQQKIAHE